MYIECRGFESHLRQLIFSRKSDCLGCAVLLCLVCLTLLASFFLPSHLSFTCFNERLMRDEKEGRKKQVLLCLVCLFDLACFFLPSFDEKEGMF